MLSGYPCLNSNFELHLTSLDCVLFHVVRASGLTKRQLGMSNYKNWAIPRIAAEYLIRCDGKTSHEEIATSIDVPFRFMLDRAIEHLMEQTRVLSFHERPSDSALMHTTGGFDSLAPLHMSIEITDSCNFRCDHCYVSASPEKLGKREYTDMQSLFATLWRHGVKIVELTGGECTTHPEFKKILEAAAARFHLVAVVSNGYLLGTRSGFADFVASFDNVCVQISIDGTQEFHDQFRKKPGSFDAAVSAVKQLKAGGAIVRIAMSVTPDNVGQVVDVFHLADDLGADAFAPSVITTFGRAENLGMCAEKDHELQHAISAALRPFAGSHLFESNRLSLEMAASNRDINCGAGWRTFALNGATGEIRSCLFLADSKKFGSVDRQEYNEIFRSEYMSMFRNAPSPSATLSTCRDCRFISTCQGCFAKAFRVSETLYPECPWRNKWFPGMQLAATPTDLVQITSRPMRNSIGQTFKIVGSEAASMV